MCYRDFCLNPVLFSEQFVVFNVLLSGFYEGIAFHYAVKAQNYVVSKAPSEQVTLLFTLPWHQPQRRAHSCWPLARELAVEVPDVGIELGDEERRAGNEKRDGKPLYP